MSIKTRLFGEVTATQLSRTHDAHSGLGATKEEGMVNTHACFFLKSEIKKQSMLHWVRPLRLTSS